MIFRETTVATVAVNVRPRSGPYGGANQWARQVCDSLRRCGYRVVHTLRPGVDAVLGTHLGLSGTLAFTWAEVAAAQKRSPRMRVIQRVNDNDVRKGTREMSDSLAEANRIADHTVFVSSWLRDHHAARWFDLSRPHSVIEPGSDPSVFHPIGNRPWQVGQPFRFVTHHWSDNMSKGFDVYSEMDRLIAEEKARGFELWVIGRWPASISWRAARTFPACSGRALADLLRKCHAYVSASRFEPGAMHPVEGIQCGLPLLYHGDSGGTASLGEQFGLVLDADVVGSMEAMRGTYERLRTAVLGAPPSGDRMCLEYRRLVQREISAAAEP
jgi:glycosyltransferase involved in cell wall biosynthesis